MHIKNLVRDIEARSGIGVAIQGLLLIAVITVLVLASAILTMDRTVRTIFTPPEINKSFWVDGRTLSPEYIEQMGEWVVYLFATTTPSSVDYKTAQILKYVHPSVHGDLAIRFKAGAKRIKQENLSRFFQPREVRISQSAHAVAFIGSLESWIADKRLPGDQLKAYLVVFDWDGAFTTIKELRETDPRFPFDAMSDQAALAADVSAEQAIVRDAPPSSSPPQAPAPVSSAEEPPRASVGGLPPQPPPTTSVANQQAIEQGQLPKDKR